MKTDHVFTGNANFSSACAIQGDLDRAMADEILSPLQLLNRDRGKTIVMVTHDQKGANYAWQKGQLVESSGLSR